MKLQLKDNKYLTTESKDKLEKCSTERIKRLSKKYHHQYLDVKNCLKIIKENKIVLNDAELNKLTLKCNTLYYLYLETWVIHSHRESFFRK